jgi:cyclophilin family peptidyl-prolyl cis-trans isomerase
VPFAIEALRRASGDVENDARIAALRTIAAAWRTDSASFSSALRDSLFRLPPPTDGAERTLGRTMSPLQHWPAASRVERPIEWYARQVREYVGRTVAGRPLTAKIVTTRGTVTISFYGADAPLTVANFALLARRGYFDGSVFHRVVPNFVAQDGDPRGDGSGGPGYAIRDELNRRWYDRGAVGMALSGPDTGGSQYFLTHSPQPHLDGHYTVFGHVVEGFAVLDGIVQGDRIVTVTVQ